MAEKILAVDDSKMNHNIISKLLADRYEVASAFSGAECLEHVKKQVPSLILLDVTMPDMDGYETCLNVRKIAELNNTPVLFLSGRCSVEEKLRGYEVGGDDYITKPFEGEEVLIKIGKFLEMRANSESLNKQVSEAKYRAQDAQLDSSLMAVTVDFLYKCNQVADASGFDELLLATFKKLNLSASWQLRFIDPYNATTEPSVNTMEIQLLDVVPSEHGEIKLGNRLLFQDKKCSLLIKNMPEEQSDYYQSLKSQLQIMVATIDSRLWRLQLFGEMKMQRNQLAKIISETRQKLQGADKLMSDYVSQTAIVVEDGVAEVQKSLEQATLSELDEQSVDGALNELLSKYQSTSTAAFNLDSLFVDIVKGIEFKK